MMTRWLLSVQRLHTLRCVAFLFALSFLVLAGCSSQRQELIESELRRKERELDELKAKVDSRDGEVRALEMELEMLQRQAAKNAKDSSSNAASGVVIIKKVRLGRMTGGYRRDVRATADDALQVFIEPIDTDDHVVKAPGSARIELLEIATNGTKTFLNQWDVSAREMRQAWESPLIGVSAYRLTFPWKVQPTTEKIRVVVKFTTMSGELYEDEKDVTITLPRPGGRSSRVVNPAPVTDGVNEDGYVAPTHSVGSYNTVAPPLDQGKKGKGNVTPVTQHGPVMPTPPRSASVPSLPPSSPNKSNVPPANYFIPPMAPMDPPLSFQMEPLELSERNVVQQTQYEIKKTSSSSTPVQIHLLKPVVSKPNE